MTPLDKLAEYVKDKPGTPLFEAMWKPAYHLLYKEKAGG
jgi:hypothetical protein